MGIVCFGYVAPNVNLNIHIPVKIKLAMFPSNCSAHFNQHFRKSAKDNENECAFSSTIVNIQNWLHQFSSRVKPLQRKRTQQDYVIDSVPVKPQTEENHVEDVMEMCNLCLFHVLLSVQ